MTGDDVVARATVSWADGLPTLDAQMFTLPCGLEVIVHEDHAVPLCAVWVGYRVGSSDEGDGTSGFAHLFEHMFKNSVHLFGRHHYEVLREAGATDTNAQTGTDRTLYHEIMPRAALETALWIEADRMGYFLPALDPKRLAKQIDVVRAERRQRYENAPYGPERFAVAETLYPDGHPLRYLTIGRQESEVQIGGGPWRVLEDGTIELPVPAASLRVAVRKDDCCEGKVVTIPAGQTRPVSITNPFLPASITPMCDAQGDLSVRIDGANATLGRSKTIFFGDTLVQQKDVEIEFVIGDKIDRQTITVRPRSTETVTCRP